MQQKKIKKSRKWFSSGFTILHTFLLYFLISQIVIIGSAYVVIQKLSVGLPKLEDLEEIPDDHELSTTIYSGGGQELRTFYKVKRVWIKYNDIPQCMIDAILSAEDSRFFSHWGVSFRDILRAMKVNILHMGVEQGASTITQQLARNLFLDRKQTIRRKLKEMIVAIDIEHTYSKSEILEFFLNNMYFGNNSSGIQSASLGYFSKDATELTASEAALLAGILASPSRLNPRSTRRPPEEQLKIVKRRRDIVLGMMYKDGKIPYWQAKEEMVKPIIMGSSGESDFGKAPYFVDYVRVILEDRYGEEFLYTSGAKIYTTLDYRLQEIAERVLKKQLEHIQEINSVNYKYIRPEGLTDQEAFEDSLDKSVVQGALVALDIRTGKILAMVGGKEYSQNDMFNRAVQAKRQAGSLFKPFIYTTALDNGWRCCDTIFDGYWSMTLPDGTIWEPRNFDEEHKGFLSLRDGFKLSQNMIAVKLVNDMENHGIGPHNVVKYARKMGINTYIPNVPSIAVGTPEVKLIEMASAYTIFPNDGIKIDAFALEEVWDKNNILIDRENVGKKSEVLKPEIASLMLNMLRSVATEGTASNAVITRKMRDRPFAGKTGTAQEYKDTWFIGFTPYLVCGIWIGFDSEETTLVKPTHTGATAALPAWIDFMAEASELLGLPKDEFTLSSGITIQRLCKDSYLLPTEYCPEGRIYNEYFIRGTEIKEYCNEHGPGRHKQNGTRFTPGKRNSRRGI
ncbi:transglycosylase domain-containing protein [Candidatus Latescibacterota bacterium]